MRVENNRFKIPEKPSTPPVEEKEKITPTDNEKKPDQEYKTPEKKESEEERKRQEKNEVEDKGKIIDVKI